MGEGGKETLHLMRQTCIICFVFRLYCRRTLRQRHFSSTSPLMPEAHPLTCAKYNARLLPCCAIVRCVAFETAFVQRTAQLMRTLLTEALRQVWRLIRECLHLKIVLTLEFHKSIEVQKMQTTKKTTFFCLGPKRWSWRNLGSPMSMKNLNFGLV